MLNDVEDAVGYELISEPNWDGDCAYDGDFFTPEVLEIVSGGFKRNSQ